ncbi:MAG: hypothetical protein AABW50_00700 [Nanoarchaeota archaeon]
MIEYNSPPYAESSIKEKRIRAMTSLYYSRPEVQKAIFSFSKNRETIPRYFEGFGKRPDSLEYPGDILELVKKGATSFHCSQEIWKNPLEVETGMKEEKLNSLRHGWDLLIDVDCKWFDYSKLAAESIIKTLKQHDIKNIGLKFSGSKGWHILIPWQAFPEEVAGVKTSDMFPEWPRIISSYIRDYSEKILKKSLPKNFHSEFKGVEIRKGVKCKNCNEIARKYNQVEFFCNFCKSGEANKVDSDKTPQRNYCPNCRREFEIKSMKEVYECSKCSLNSINNKSNFIIQREEIDIYDLMGLDLILVSPRHLFRAPYSLHEKTALASAVINETELLDFNLKDADPLKVKIRNFLPDAKEGEASELLMQALDWSKNIEKPEKKLTSFAPIKIEKFSDSHLPPSIQKILQGIDDGRKRALFILLNLFRSIGMDKEEIEKRIEEWNKKNKVPLRQGYIQAQFDWSFRNKPVLPPNFDKDYYKAIGVVPNEEELRYKNPVAYVVRKIQGGSYKDNKNKKYKKEK